MDTPKTVSVVGASGLAGQELVRLLLAHPGFALAALYAGEAAGQQLAQLNPAFAGQDLPLRPLSELAQDTSALVMLAVPHGQARVVLAQLNAAKYPGKVIDLSTDHRPPAMPQDAAYGLPEWYADAIAQASLVANPGCFATLLQLALGPLVAAQAADAYHITAITGSTGAGRGLKPAVHFTHRHANLRAYKLLAHQHLAEVKASLQAHTGQPVPEVLFTPVSGPFTRGIWLSLSCVLNKPWDAQAAYEQAYSHQPFVRLQAAPAELHHVVGTNHADLHLTQQGQQLVVTAALDNLLKGAAGQALQNANLMFGYPQPLGLPTVAMV